MVKFPFHNTLRDFKLIQLNGYSVDQLKGMRTDDDVAVIISTTDLRKGERDITRGHLDCYNWGKSSKGKHKKGKIANYNCSLYHSFGCRATKRKWSCLGDCEFSNNFCCGYFKGLELLVLIYSFKHNHKPQQNDDIEIEEIKRGDSEKSDNENGYVEEELVSEYFEVVSYTNLILNE